MTSSSSSSAVIKTLLLTDLVDSTKLVERLGDAKYTGPVEQEVTLVRDAVRRALGAEKESENDYEFGVASPLQAELFDEGLSQGGDPEKCLKPWVRNGGPLGVAAEIETTFASGYTRQVSLAEALDLTVMAGYGRQATGEKVLIDPQRGA